MRLVESIGLRVFALRLDISVAIRFYVKRIYVHAHKQITLNGLLKSNVQLQRLRRLFRH